MGGGGGVVICVINGVLILSGESINKYIFEDRLNVGCVYGNKYLWYL